MNVGLGAPGVSVSRPSLRRRGAPLRPARRRPDLPIVLTTGFSEAAAQARAQGFRLLLKPYRIEALASALEAARRSKRSSAAAE